MIQLSTWIDEFLDALDNTFGDRVWFAGIQGSYARGDATEKSDIDTVVILNEFSSSDIKKYSSMLDTLPNRGLICGFISGKKELFSWETSDLFQFYYDTKPLYGSLDELLPLLDDAAVLRAIKIGVCNIYHSCVHNMLHEKSEENLKALYKSASFVLYAIAFSKTGEYINHLADLRTVLSNKDRDIIDIFLALKAGELFDFECMSEKLFEWAREYLE